MRITITIMGMKKKVVNKTKSGHYLEFFPLLP